MRSGVMFMVLIVGLTGCGSKPPMVGVSGVVTLNGKPVEHCQVCFVPDQEDPNPLVHGYGLAWTDAEGCYTLQNTLGDTGIFPGKYKVLLVHHTNRSGKPLPRTAKPSETPGGFVNQMPPQYSEPHSTPESVEVPRGGCEKNFAIVK